MSGRQLGYIKTTSGDIIELHEEDYIRSLEARDLALVSLVDYKSNPNEYLRQGIAQALATFYGLLLNAEFLVHIGYEKSGNAKVYSENRRNGYVRKNVRSSFGQLDILVPRDREGSFSPIAIRKHSRAVTSNDAKLMAIYAHALDEDQIAILLHKMYFRELNAECIDIIKDRVIADVRFAQARRLLPLYSFVLISRISFEPENQIAQGEWSKHSLMLVQGVDLKGNREVLEIFFSPPSPNSSSQSILEALKGRGVEDIMMVLTDGLPLTNDALHEVYPYAVLCNDIKNNKDLNDVGPLPKDDAELASLLKLHASKIK